MQRNSTSRAAYKRAAEQHIACGTWAGSGTAHHVQHMGMQRNSSSASRAAYKHAAEQQVGDIVCSELSDGKVTTHARRCERGGEWRERGRGISKCSEVGNKGTHLLYLSFPYPFVDKVGAGSEEVLVDLEVVANTSAKGTEPLLPEYTLVSQKGLHAVDLQPTGVRLSMRCSIVFLASDISSQERSSSFLMFLEDAWAANDLRTKVSSTGAALFWLRAYGDGLGSIQLGTELLGSKRLSLGFFCSMALCFSAASRSCRACWASSASFTALSCSARSARSCERKRKA